MRDTAFGERLRALRGQHSKAEFARLLGLSAQDYHRYEDGRMPRADTLMEIAKRRGVAVDWLIGAVSSHDPSALPSGAHEQPTTQTVQQNHQNCRFPSNCDLVQELASHRAALAQMQEQLNTLPQLQAQLNTLTQLLGATLAASSQPGAANNNKKAG